MRGTLEAATTRCELPADEGCPGEGMAEPRSLLSAIEPTWQRTSMRSKLRDNPSAVVVCSTTTVTLRKTATSNRRPRSRSEDGPASCILTVFRGGQILRCAGKRCFNRPFASPKDALRITCALRRHFSHAVQSPKTRRNCPERHHNLENRCTDSRLLYQ